MLEIKELHDELLQCGLKEVAYVLGKFYYIFAYILGKYQYLCSE